MVKLKSKPCDICHKLVDIRYRVRYQEQGDWALVCPGCWHEVSQNNPNYSYGGTWKAKR